MAVYIVLHTIIEYLVIDLFTLLYIVHTPRTKSDSNSPLFIHQVDTELDRGISDTNILIRVGVSVLMKTSK